MTPVKGDERPVRCPQCELGLTRFKFNQVYIHVGENDEETICVTPPEREPKE